MPDNLFTVKQASEITDASRQSIRSYTATYARFFSTEATPEHGGERKFTRDDLKLIAYIAGSTAFGSSHEEIIKELEGDALSLFRWEPPEAPPKPSEPKQDANTSLVPIERLHAMAAQLHTTQALIEKGEERIKEETARAQVLQDKLIEAQRELGKLEGELAALKASKPKGFWARLLGGGE